MGLPAPLFRLQGESRYELLVRVAAGGMATVYVARERGKDGLIAIKRTHTHLVEDPEQRRRLLREAKLASCIEHPNVVSVREIEELEAEILLVMDYVEGASLAELLVAADGKDVRIAPAIAARILLDAAAGLDAAHVACDVEGRPLNVIHRDVSPQNILVGVDGVARVVDFGIAKESEGTSSTVTGALKGKLAYMAPEYVAGRPADARVDVFAMGVVLWETLSGERLFRGSNDAETLRRVLEAYVPSLGSKDPVLAPFEVVVETALGRAPEDRYQTAGALAAALQRAATGAGLLATHEEVSALVWSLVGPALEKRRAKLELLNDPPSEEAERTLNTREESRTNVIGGPSKGSDDETATRRRVQAAPAPSQPLQRRTLRMTADSRAGIASSATTGTPSYPTGAAFARSAESAVVVAGPSNKGPSRRIGAVAAALASVAAIVIAASLLSRGTSQAAVAASASPAEPLAASEAPAPVATASAAAEAPSAAPTSEPSAEPVATSAASASAKVAPRSVQHRNHSDDRTKSNLGGRRQVTSSASAASTVSPVPPDRNLQLPDNPYGPDPKK